MEETPGESLCIQYWRGQIEEELEEIRELNRENKELQVLRETKQDPETQMTIREILFLNARCIQLLKARIDDTEATIEELSRL